MTTIAEQLQARAQAEVEHDRRVKRLEAAGWQRVEDGWELDTSNPRWSTIAHERVTGSGFEQNTIAAYGVQVRLEAERLRRRRDTERAHHATGIGPLEKHP